MPFSRSFGDFLADMAAAHNLLETWFGSEESRRRVHEAISEFADETRCRIYQRLHARVDAANWESVEQVYHDLVVGLVWLPSSLGPRMAPLRSQLWRLALAGRPQLTEEQRLHLSRLLRKAVDLFVAGQQSEMSSPSVDGLRHGVPSSFRDESGGHS